MKTLWKSPTRRVGVCFELSQVSLAVRRGHWVAAAVEDPRDAEQYRSALASLVAQEGVMTMRCAISLPAAKCLVRCVSLNNTRRCELRVAVNHPVFWRTHLGIDSDKYALWWRFTRDGTRRLTALLAAAPREEVDFYIGIIRGAGLKVGSIGISYFDYFESVPAAHTTQVTLVIDCDDSYVLAAGAFGIRTQVIELGRQSIAALSCDGTRAYAAVVDTLAACVHRCVEDERTTQQHGIELRVIAAHGGDWLTSLQAQLPEFGLKWVAGWQVAGLDAPQPTTWRLPRATMRVMRARPRGIASGCRPIPRDWAIDFAPQGNPCRRWVFATAAAVCLLASISAYIHGALLAEHRQLQPDAQRYLQLADVQARSRAEIKDLRTHLSHRVSFYSGIQRISFERKLMPRLFALIEYAAFEGVWLKTIHFKQPGFLRISGTSLDNEHIADFIERLRSADEVAEVFLKSAASSGEEAPSSERRLKDFVVSCHLKSPQEET